VVFEVPHTLNMLENVAPKCSLHDLLSFLYTFTELLQESWILPLPCPMRTYWNLKTLQKKCRHSEIHIPQKVPLSHQHISTSWVKNSNSKGFSVLSVVRESVMLP